MRLVVLDHLLREEEDGGGRDPLPGVDAPVDPDPRAATGVGAAADAEHAERTALVRVADGLQLGKKRHRIQIKKQTKFSLLN